MENTEMRETTALTVVDADPAPAQSWQWSEEDVQALRTTVAKDCNPAQFRVFVVACQRLRLDPFARQITPIVQGQRMTPQVTIDGFRLIAERTRKYAGQIGPFWCGADGEWHDVWLADGDPVACKVGVVRRDFAQPMWGVARMKSYKQSGSPTWQKMPDVMIAKVAESVALRKAFPQELSGVYSEEEMAQAAQDVTPTTSATTETPVTQATRPAPAAQPAKPATKTASANDRKAPPAEGSLRLLGVKCGLKIQEDYNAMVRRVTGKSKGWTTADQWLVFDYLTEKQAIDAQRAADEAIRQAQADDEPELVFEEATA